MFEAKEAMFLYCVSPVHMGAGTQLGAIDNPIQRERHTAHPMMVGSGIKGALRHDAAVRWEKPEMVGRIFGPDAGKGENASDHAGAISFSDAQLVLFPVRSLKQTYVYATCPTALARLQRTLMTAGVEGVAEWKIPTLEQDQCVVLEKDLLVGENLILEAFQFEAVEGWKEIKGIAKWLAEHAMAAEPTFFADKVRAHMVVLHDDRFNYFVRNATVVEAHVRINDETGTADDGGLFYTENLPPESLLVSLAMASRERYEKKKAPAHPIDEAKNVLVLVKSDFDGTMVQVGGDATSGRGQVMVRFAGGGQ